MSDKLAGWDAIASYLRVSTKTAQRWRRLGLPVIMPPHHGVPVTAWKGELDRFIGCPPGDRLDGCKEIERYAILAPGVVSRCARKGLPIKAPFGHGAYVFGSKQEIDEFMGHPGHDRMRGADAICEYLQISKRKLDRWKVSGLPVHQPFSNAGHFYASKSQLDAFLGIPGEDRLDCWKDIANFIGYSVRSAQRFAEQGMPVIRHHVLSALFGSKTQIHKWMEENHAQHR